ncbi:hypothetical protein OSB04_002023 [Centaurea solstitialis]|uniref:Uncharacterized protein n=1 Tax=Centaurea solstitialis TaxID=347529 RepID=A0AA38WLY7_9ASTR|nr:hypothetical protein OSB04_002023 [Centaurea solstitialis]
MDDNIPEGIDFYDGKGMGLSDDDDAIGDYGVSGGMMNYGNLVSLEGSYKSFCLLEKGCLHLHPHTYIHMLGLCARQ